MQARCPCVVAETPRSIVVRRLNGIQRKSSQLSRTGRRITSAEHNTMMPTRVFPHLPTASRVCALALCLVVGVQGGGSDERSCLRVVAWVRRPSGRRDRATRTDRQPSDRPRTTAAPHRTHTRSDPTKNTQTSGRNKHEEQWSSTFAWPILPVSIMSWYPVPAPHSGLPAAPLPPHMMPFGFLPPATAYGQTASTPAPPVTSQPLLPMSAAFSSAPAPVAPVPPAAAAATTAETASYTGKRPYSTDDTASKYARTDDSARGGRGRGRGGSRGGRGGRGGASASGLPEHLSKYLTPVAGTPAARPFTAMYSSATGTTVTAPPTPAPAPVPSAGPVYCQRYMNNLCALRSSDEPPSDTEEEHDDHGHATADSSATAAKASRVARCEFVHDAEFRRQYLARAHYTHTKYTQVHKDAPTAPTRGGRGGRGGRSAGPTLDPRSTSGADGRLAGLKPPVAESALLRKVRHILKHGPACGITRSLVLCHLHPLAHLPSSVLWCFCSFSFSRASRAWSRRACCRRCDSWWRSNAFSRSATNSHSDSARQRRRTNSRRETSYSRPAVSRASSHPQTCDTVHRLAYKLPTFQLDTLCDRPGRAGRSAELQARCAL